MASTDQKVVIEQKDKAVNEDRIGRLPLLKTKLYRPPATPDLEQRSRLIERLERNRHRPLTLISAPAGYGKTMLASMWLESCGCPSGWVSLDEEDNDLVTFISYLLAALNCAFPSLQLETLALLEAPTIPSVPVLALYLLNDLEQIQEPFILVLDDTHRIHEQPIFDLLSELLQHPAPNMHLVLIGRHDPKLQTASLRANSLITEIRAWELRFTPQETAGLLSRMLDRQVDQMVAAEWAQKTEGWVTALRLAALSLRHRGLEDDLRVSIRGDSRYLNDYLLAEVLVHLPDVYQAWLLKSAVLERFCAPLCEVVCQTDTDPAELSGEAFIERLERENLFLIPLDDQNQWFRFHHLFQENLLNLLKPQLSAEEISALHLRASCWYAENNLVDEALHYALDAGDTSGAVGLVAQHRYQLINNEDWNQLTNWIRLFPENVIDNDPILAITKAHLPSSYGAELARILSFIHQLVADLPDDSSTARVVNGEIAYFGSMWATMIGPPAVATEQGNDALMLLPQQAQRFRSTVLGFQAIGYQMLGDYKRGLNHLNKTVNDPGWSANARATLMIGQSYVCFMEGDLEALPRYASNAVKIASKIRVWHTIGEGFYLWGISHYFRNELDLAEPHLRVLMDQLGLCTPIHLAMGVCALTRIYRAQRQPDKARQVFDLAFSYLEEVENNFSLDLLHAFQVELALDEGDLTLARRLSRSIDFDMDRVIWFHYTIQLVPIKLWLAEGTAGSLEQALIALEKLDQKMVELNRKTQHIEVLALLALVHEARGNRKIAGECLQSALALGAIGGNLRSFVDLGTPMMQLLSQLKRQKISKENERYLNQILGAFLETSESPAIALQSQLVDTLTNREMEVLRLLAKRLSNKEIAAQLVISPRTVKRHTLNIYKKLDVNSRLQAVQKASELRILF